MPRIPSYPAGTQGETATVVVDQDSATHRLTLPAHASAPAATKAETRLGAETIKVVTPATLAPLLEIHNTEGARLWSDWAALTVGESSSYGADLVTGLHSYHDSDGGQITSDLLTPSTLARASGTVYGDMGLVYNAGFASGVPVPAAPQAGDRWETSLCYLPAGTGARLLVRWRFAGVKLYRSDSSDTATIAWREITPEDGELVHNPRAIEAGTGWHLVAAGASEVPLTGSENDFINAPWVCKIVGSTLYAISCGFEDAANRTYRVGTSTRTYQGAATVTGDPVNLVGQASDVPSTPVLDSFVFCHTSFSTFIKGRFYRWDGTAWVAQTLDLTNVRGQITISDITSGSAGNNTVPTADGNGGIVWRDQQGGSGGSGSAHPYIITGNFTAPDTWQVNDIVINNSSTNSTVARGTDTNNILLPRSWNRIVSISTNEISFADLQIRGSLVVGQRTININKIDPGSATDGQVAQVDTVGGTKQVVYGNLPNNSVGYDQINDISKGANRIIHYNAAGNGVTSSPHTDFDIDGTQITSGTIPAARIPNLSATIITSGTLDANRLPEIPASKIPTETLAGVPLAPDLNTLWHSPGIYRVAPNTPNSPDHGGQGMLVANVNDQTFFDDGVDAGAIHARNRAITITGQGTPSTLATESDVTFTRITNMLTNLNTINPAAGTKAYYYWHADSRGTGNTAGTDRPVNSPGYGGHTGTLNSSTRQDRTAFGEFTSKYQIVCTGGTYLFNVSNNAFFYRTRNAGDTGWNNTWTQVRYVGTGDPPAGQVDVTALSALHQYGFNMVRAFNHLPGNTASTHEYYWFIPLGIVANHPNGNTSSSSPFLTRYVSVSGSTELRCIYNIGEDSGSGTNTYPRAESVPFTETATAWALVNDSISGGAYSSSNGTLTLTQRFGANVSITGLPYVTSS